MSKLRDPRHRHDAFFRKARGAGFAARSVYKLEEIDRKLRLLRAGDRVLDLGCRPGSWLQYALKVVGPHGAVVGIDRDPLPQPIPGARVLHGDLLTTPDGELLGNLAAFDVVLSDMAPEHDRDPSHRPGPLGVAVRRGAGPRGAPAGARGRLRREDLPGPRRREICASG